MAKIECSITYDTVENKDGYDVSGTIATCQDCGHEVTSYGTTDRSVKRCFAVMKEECPSEENNFYVEE